MGISYNKGKCQEGWEKLEVRIKNRLSQRGSTEVMCMLRCIDKSMRFFGTIV